MQLKSALKGTALLLWLACSLFFVCILLLPMRGIAAELAGQWFWQTEEGAAAGEPWEEVHIAMGIAVYDPQQDHSVMDTVRRADKVMYTNKRIRKNMRNNA